MTRTLITTRGAAVEPTADNLARRLKGSDAEGLWLDIQAPDDDDFEVLERVFRFHPLTIEDVKNRNQRPKLEEYPGYSFVVAFASEWAEDRLTLVEHHVYLSARYIVTVHLEPAATLAALRERIRQSPEMDRGSAAFLTYLVIDAVIDANFPTLDRLDDLIDDLQEGIVLKPNPAHLTRLSVLKHDVVELRRVLSAQRDVFQRLITHSLDVQQQEVSLYWRDVQDHILRQYETIDSLRDLLTGAMDIYLSTVSNRLNTTMKTLTIVASLFLPLTWLTGFYGMNFTFLTGTLEPPVWAFWVAVATMVGSLVVQVVLFRRRGWL
jgi:magnesium transporter